jgi:hypothetical protein
VPHADPPLARYPFAYTVIRVVPRVERQEFVNAGIVLYSRPRRYLGARTVVDPVRWLALWPGLDIGAVERQLDIICLVANGDPAGGSISLLPPAERFGWLSAPASTVVQPGPVHPGLADNPEAALDELFAWMVATPRA